MKFKSIFWTFNIVAVASLVFVVMLSVFIMEKSGIVPLWDSMWMLFLAFPLFIIVFDFYFIQNWKLLTFLENEDRPALLAWLEERLYIKGRVNRVYANLLINTALSVSNFDAVSRLETEVRQRKPRLYPTLGVSLGIPVLLQRDWNEIRDYFAPLADDPKTKRRDWAMWCRSLVQGRDGINELLELTNSRDISIQILSIQVLHQYYELLSEENRREYRRVKDILSRSLKNASSERLLQRSREDHLMAVVLSSRVDEAIENLFIHPDSDDEGN